MIVTLPQYELDSLIKACATASLDCEVLIDNDLCTVMILNEGEEITPLMGYRIGALAASIDENERLSKLNR